MLLRDVWRTAFFGVISLGLAACGDSTVPASPAVSSVPSQPASTAPASAAAAVSSAGAPSSKPVAASAVGSALGSAAPAPLNPPVSLKVGVLGVEAEAGLYLASDRGYFKDEGLNVEFVPFGSGQDQAGALLSNSIQFATAAPTAAQFNAAGRGVALKLVAAQAEFHPPDEKNAALIIRQDLFDSGAYKDPKDLKGKTITGTGSGSISDMYLERILNKVGLQLADVSTTFMPVPDVPAALANKKIDGAWSFEPFITIAQQRQFAKIAVPVGQILQAKANPATLVASSNLLAQQPEAVKRFVAAHLRGQREYYDAFQAGKADKEPIIQVLMAHTPVKDANLYKVLDMHKVDPNGAIDDKELGLAQDYFLKAGVQKQRIDLAQFIDRSYIEYALQRLGTR